MKTFEQFNNDFDELPNNRLFIYLQQKFEPSKYNILLDNDSYDTYIDIIDGKEHTVSKKGFSNTFFDFVNSLTVEELQQNIEPYLSGKIPDNPHKGYKSYVEFSKFLKPILDEWNRKSDKEKSKYVLSEEEIKELIEGPIQHPPGEVICIEDYHHYVNEETLAYNNITDPNFVCYKKGETYDYDGFSGDDMIATYVTSKLKNPHAEHHEDQPKMIYQMFIVKRSDEELKKLKKHRAVVNQLLKQRPDMKLSDFPDPNSGQLFFKHFKITKHKKTSN
tara:strand:+ start:6618 stop:7445 length:828 start_codon:yes stop_codon:yes gene_type:complete